MDRTTSSAPPSDAGEQPGDDDAPPADVDGPPADTDGPPADTDGPPPTTIRVHRAGDVIQSTDIGELPALRADPATECVWIDLIDPDEELVRTIGKELELHPLIAEDISEKNQRAKIETFGDIVHIVLFGVRYAGEAEVSELDFVLGDRFLLTVHGPEVDLAGAAALRMNAETVMARGADYLFYSLADHIVDAYFPVLDVLADEIDDLQDSVVASADDWTLQRLFALKRELIAIRRATSPAREIFNQLTNRDLALIAPDHIVYFRDVYDHLIRVTDELDNDRELVAGTLEVYLSTVNNNLSTIMKRLTGVTVILAGVGAAAGVFGMSEAGLALRGGEGSGFWLVTAMIVMGAALTAFILRRIDWI